MAPPLLFSLECEKLTDFVFVGFRGKEQISRPYEIDFYFTVPIGTSVREAVGERATILGDRKGEGEPFVLHGVIAKISLVHQAADRALYRGLLVPRLWLLQHFWRSFVFTQKKLHEFLSDTLEAGGLAADEFRFDVDKGLRAPEEFVAQYRESHLDFFHRWLEREGLYYHFEHARGAKSEVLVIVDHKSHTEAFPGGGRVRYVPLADPDAASAESLNHLEADIRWLPKTVTLAEYDYANPSLALKSNSDVTAKGVGAIREYGYRAFVDGDLKRLAKVKAESIGCREDTLRARGGALGPRAGYKLAIDGRPDDLQEEWLAVDVEHAAAIAGMTPETARLTGLSANTVYAISILAVPASVQYRAPQATAWPRIYGFENAQICGEADSPYAQIDPDGRYLVRFEFDTSDLPDGKASTRVRMLQPHGGEKEGFHFPLRKGTEVMIAFLGGDCDRPFIAGVVPNAHKPSVVGQRNHTQNIIRTGSNNQIVMEDEAGKEFIFMHTPNAQSGIYLGAPAKNHSSVYTGETKKKMGGMAKPSSSYPGSDIDVADELFTSLHTTSENYGNWVGGDYWEEVDGSKNGFVGRNTFLGYKGKYQIWVGGATSEVYFDTRDTKTKKAWTDTVESGGLTQSIKPFLHQTVEGSGWQKVKTNWDHKVDGKAWDDYGEWKTSVQGTWNSQTGDWTHKSPNVTWTVGTKVEINAPTVIIKGVSIEKHVESWFEAHHVKNEAYVGKNAVGVEKFDGCALSMAVTAVKTEGTGIARAFTALKIENTGIAKATTALKIEDTGFKKTINGGTDMKEGMQLSNSALRLLQHVFCKV
ncbi:MAG: type VI secretion system tip protein TssI/VgrG [Polyangiaceae bacterium]